MTGCEIRGGRWGGGAAAALGLILGAPLWLRGTVRGTGFRHPAGMTDRAVSRDLRRPGAEAGGASAVNGRDGAVASARLR